MAQQENYRRYHLVTITKHQYGAYAVTPRVSYTGPAGDQVLEPTEGEAIKRAQWMVARMDPDARIVNNTRGEG